MVHIWVYTCYIMDTYTNAMPHDDDDDDDDDDLPDNIFEKKFHSFKNTTRYWCGYKITDLCTIYSCNIIIIITIWLKYSVFIKNSTMVWPKITRHIKIPKNSW